MRFRATLDVLAHTSRYIKLGGQGQGWVSKLVGGESHWWVPILSVRDKKVYGYCSSHALEPDEHSDPIRVIRPYSNVRLSSID